MTTLAAFHTKVSTEIRRGTTFDTNIPDKVQQAVAWIEGLHTFKHMEHYANLTIDSALASPRAIPLPTGFKSMKSWRIVNSDGSYSNINKVEYYDVSKVDLAKPTAYWQDGMDYFWLDNTPDQNYLTEMAYVGLTILPTDTSQSPYVTNNFEALILAQTLILMAPLLRSPEIVALYKPQRDELMKAAIDQDVEAREAGSSGDSMEYGAEFKEEINANNSN